MFGCWGGQVTKTTKTTKTTELTQAALLSRSRARSEAARRNKSHGLGEPIVSGSSRRSPSYDRTWITETILPQNVQLDPYSRTGEQ
jgi:hypothetical protein